VFWRWSNAAVDHAMLTGRLFTVFGWQVQVPSEANPRSPRNFPMQANGAEMLRLACCLATESGIEVCAPIHDALMLVAPLERLDADVRRMQHVVREASRIVLAGFELGTDAYILRYPERYMDERGAVMWQRVMTLLERAGLIIVVREAGRFPKVTLPLPDKSKRQHGSGRTRAKTIKP
jgi:hypothetical protein